ncbi:non-ribosomal peptide synthetase, partial [Flavobacterium notoginsengisoli]|uniref:non-ribosomal peptide synthetase n=1 Tax=Flavobacterium notoginsengisoli TaxID=1478199 RepID=UPI003644C303
MNVEILNILKEAHAKGVKLGINGDSLTIKSVDSIDSDLLQKIKDNKIYILEYIQKLKIKNKKNVLPKVTPGNGDSLERIPLSFGQERLWFLDQLQGSIEYHMPVVLKLSGILNFSYLESSLSCIIDRHEVLRTNIVSQNGIGHQELVSSNNWILENKILNTNDNLEEMISSFLELPFDLSKDYKLRACLYELGNQEYVLACVFHHIASDGWSEGIFSYELKELYCSFQNNRKVVLPELALQYRDYAIWQRNYLAGSVLESQLSYWEAKLKGATTLILPYDNPRPSVQSTAGASVSIVLDKKLTVALESLCQEEGVTFFMMMLSAFKVLLSKYSGQDDICVGTPIANRTQVELEGMIGFFLNTLALRSDLSGNPTFKELLLRVKETTLEGYDHQLTPFEKVVDRVVRNRDMSMSPLFQVLFVLQNTPESSKETPTELEGITITGYKFDSVTSKFDLMLTISEDSLGLVLNLEYSTVLFDKPTIERMLGHYEQLLACIAADASQPIGSLSMLSAHEEHQLLDVFNATGVDYPLDRTVVDLFEEQVVKSPDAIAVVFEGEQLSYRELDERSNQLAHYLRGRGVVADTLVGICLERSVEMLVGILGILKSSGAYVPIDPEYPVERIGYMLEDAAIQLVLSSSASHAALKEHPVSVLLLDDQWDLICGHPSGKPDTVLLPHNLAYVIYTSGSTGNPKGVMIEHTNVVRLFKNESCLYDFESSDVWTLFHSFCFDFSVWEMYGALLFGGRLVIVPKAATKDSIAFKELLVKEGVTVLNQTPGSFYAFQEEFLHGSFEHSLRYVIFGGEALNPSYLRNWKQTYPDCALINMYGITETTVHVTYKEITEIEVLNSVSNIGSAIPTLGCYIVDSDLNLVPVGVVGELCVGGAGVARGYLNREALTEEKFVKNPFEESNFKLYRSGDLARWLPDGNLEYIGRSDAQVKIRGYRIELGEIENALSLMD